MKLFQTLCYPLIIGTASTVATQMMRMEDNSYSETFATEFMDEELPSPSKTSLRRIAKQKYSHSALPLRSDERRQQQDDNQCIDYTIDGGNNWHDSYNGSNNYDCEWYSSGSRCSKYGEKYKNYGKTANGACCACGGGEKLVKLKEPTNVPVELLTPPKGSNGDDEEESCEDVSPDWHDAGGESYDCDWYAKKKQGKQDRCEGFGNDHSNDGHTAKTACCVCGGGKKLSNPTLSFCADVTVTGGKAWHDVDGEDFGCEWYMDKGNCKDRDCCEQWGNGLEKYGYTANEACCVCGGGMITGSFGESPPAPSPIKVVDQTGRTPGSVEGEEWVKQHNKRREKYQKMYNYDYIPIEWDLALAKSAQSYAEYLVNTAHEADKNADNCHLYHVQDGFPGGENLAANPGDTPDDIDNVLYRWTEKEHDGNKDKIGIREESKDKPAGHMDFFIHGHFTQVVWGASTKLGCGAATKKGGQCTVQVCRYGEPGNCSLCDGGKSCSPRSIPPKQWQKKALAASSPCKIPKQWWDDNQ